MNVLLISPNMPYHIKGDLQTPLGICYLSSAVKNIANTKVFDCNVSDNLIETVMNFRPDIVGISILTATYTNAVNILKKIKATVKNDCIFIAGGIHASTFPKDMLDKGFDIVIRGEGELTFYKLVYAITYGEDYSNISGISYIDNIRQLHNNDDAPRIENLDELCFPDRKDLSAKTRKAGYIPPRSAAAR